jgi:hypothetical protein
MLRAVLAVSAAVAVLLGPSLPASAVSQSGSDSRPSPSRVFAGTSPFYQKLPDSTPKAADSAGLVASLNEQAHTYYGTAAEANVNVNYKRFSPALYVAYNTDPVYDIKGWNCQRKWNGWDTELNRQLKGVHIPVDMQPDDSTDGSVSIYNPETRELVELWKAQKVNGEWQACWGGRISNADYASGTFGNYYGASASGMALWALTIRQQELLRGRIDHVISLAIPRTKKGVVSWPANRTDGNSGGTELAIGQRLRLPASLNLDAMKLSPVARTIAKAAQEYGIVVADTSGSVVFSAENPVALAKDQYDTVFRGRWPFLEMSGNKAKGEVPFPLDKLVALPLNYQVPASTPTSTVKANTAYAATVKAAKPAINWRLADTGSIAADASGKKRTGTLNGVQRYVEGAIAGNTAVATMGDATSGVYQSSRTTPSKKFSVQVWFRTRTRSGGKIVGFENTQVGKGSRADRSLYMTDDGRLVFGTYTSVIKKVVTTGSYNDGEWHQATATQGTRGTRLYVDGYLVAGNDVTGAQAGPGYWRLGGGNLDAWPYRPGSAYFAGALDEFAYYDTTLSDTTIARQYRAAG